MSRKIKKQDRAGRVFRTLRIDLASGPAKEGEPVAAPVRLLGDGSLAVPARISRIGCLEYSSEEGPPFVEYRDPSEVFALDALDSFKGITVTQLHPDTDVTPDNWRRHSIGHVADDVRAEGDYVAATLVIKDPSAIKAIQAKELREISAGYWADVEVATGTYNGQTYDGVQKNIRGNHVALGPSDWGRSGPEVRIRIDAKNKGKKDMKYQEMIDLLASLVTSGALTQEQSDEIAKALVDPDAAEEEAPTEDTAAGIPAEGAEVEAGKPSPKADAAKLLADAQAGFQRSLEIRDHARKILGFDFELPKTDGEIMLAVIRSEDAKFDAKGKGAEYIRGRFDCVKPKSEKKDSSEGISSLRSVLSFDAGDTSAPKTSGNSIKDRQIAHYNKMTGKVQ